MRTDKDEIARLKAEVVTLQKKLNGGDQIKSIPSQSIGELKIENAELKEKIKLLTSRLLLAEAIAR